MDWAEQVREGARRALPPVEGELSVPGLADRVEVIRDRWGVPHAYASNLPDLFLAQGFVVGSERLFQLDMILRAANGRLATMFGALVLPADRFARLIGWNRAGVRLAQQYDEDSTMMTSAFRAGVRAWLEQMPAPPVEYQVLDLAPEIPDDPAYWASATAYLAWGLSGNADRELVRAEIAERLGPDALRDLFPDVPGVSGPLVAGGREALASAVEVLRSAPSRPPGLGSNNWVVAGSRTETGKPLLANDPHLGVATPSIWFECHLSAPGYEASGVSLPFAPGVVIGRTAHHAWGFTNVGGDTQDLYLEQLSEDGSSARYEDAWEPLTVHREELWSRGSEEPLVLEVRETRHGPILDSYALGIVLPRIVEGGVREPYALRWVGAEHALPPSTLLRIAQATDFEAFRAAVRDWGSPGQNMVYADVDGTIGYQCTGRYPVRRAGDGTMPVPGWTAEHEWDGFVAFDDLPWAMNPESGFLATANNRIHDASYPHLIGHDWSPPSRIRRIGELLAAAPTHSRDTFAAIHADTVSIPARELADVLSDIEPANERQRDVITWFAGWDGDLDADSATACAFEAWCVHLAREILLPRLGQELFDHYYADAPETGDWRALVLPNLLANPTAAWFGSDGLEARDDVLRRALDAALDELTERLGPDPSAWRWGALHRVVFAGPLAMIADLAPMFTAGVVEVGGDDDTVNQGAFEPGIGYDAAVIASWRQIVDLADPDAALGMHTTGQSGHPSSEHWNDLVPMWASANYHALPFTRPAVDVAAMSSMTLVPR
jgi:penicillin amidase